MSSTQTHVLIRCSSCRTLNRVAKDKILVSPQCGECKNTLTFPVKPLDIGSSSFQKEVLDWAGAVLIDFWAPTCGYCLRLNPLLDELAYEKRGLLKIVKVNTAIEQSLAAGFQIRGVPALFLYQNGKKMGEMAGALPKKQLEEWVFKTAGV